MVNTMEITNTEQDLLFFELYPELRGVVPREVSRYSEKPVSASEPIPAELEHSR